MNGSAPINTHYVKLLVELLQPCQLAQLHRRIGAKTVRVEMAQLQQLAKRFDDAVRRLQQSKVLFKAIVFKAFVVLTAFVRGARVQLSHTAVRPRVDIEQRTAAQIIKSSGVKAAHDGT